MLGRGDEFCRKRGRLFARLCDLDVAVQCDRGLFGGAEGREDLLLTKRLFTFAG